jgi:hypothetical protein
MKIIFFVFILIKYFYKIKSEDIDQFAFACTEILKPTPENCMVASLNKTMKCCYFYNNENEKESCKYINIKNVKQISKREKVKINCSSNFIQYNLIIIFISFLFF